MCGVAEGYRTDSGVLSNFLSKRREGEGKQKGEREC